MRLIIFISSSNLYQIQSYLTNKSSDPHKKRLFGILCCNTKENNNVYPEQCKFKQ